jgi:tetratricopeptide (TPR) repeat protein
MASTLAEDDEQATALWRAAVDLEPDNLLLRSMLAQRLEQAGDTDQARSLLEKGARRVDSAAAWQLLGDFQRRQGDNEAAEVAIRKARSKGSVASSALQMGHAEILADLGDTREAKKLAEQLEDPGLRELLNARILVAEGDYEGALAAFDVGLPAWPNNPIARLLAGYTAERVGNFDRALSEYRSAVRSARGQTDAALAAAQLYYTLGRYREALELGRIHGQSKRPTAALGRIIAARASTALGRYETARKIVEGLDGDQQQALPALLERARIERHAVGPQAAAAVFEQSDIDLLASENETALRAFVSDLLDADRLADALRSVDRALARREAEAASLHDLRGRILIKQDRIAKGQKELDRALEIDPSYAPAFAGLATLAARRGDLETAIELFDRAVEKDPSDVESRYHATQLLGRLGRTNEAETRLSALLDETPGHASACNDLAWIIADQGSDFDQALTFAERAVLLETNANTLDTLGWVRFKRGEYEAARNAFERAVNLDPTEPGIRYRLGRTLHANGNVADAAAAYRQALASGPFQEAAATRRELATLDASSRTSEGQEVP